jgi:hypothetical protein
MSRSVLESLPVNPPVHAFNDTKNFPDFNGSDWWDVQIIQGYAGDANNQNANDAQNVAYIRYTAPAGAVLEVVPYFGDAVPDPAVLPDGTVTDGCHHAHLEFAVYRTGFTFINLGFFYFPVPAISLLSSSGELGRRIDPNTGNQVMDGTPGSVCEVTSAPDSLYPSFTSTFDWGHDIVNVPFGQFGNTTYYTAIVAAQAVSHGWGSCGNFLCFQSVGIETFRLQ